MKKTLCAFLLALWLPAVQATDPVMFTQPSGRGTGNDVWVELTRDGLANAGISHRYEVGTCHTSITAWNKAGTQSPALMLYSSNWARKSMQTGIPCIMQDFDRVTVYAVIRQPWWICHNSRTSQPINAAKVRVGFSDKIIPMDQADFFQDINRTNNFNWQFVPNNGSGDAFLMLANGDVDYAFVSKNFAKNKLANSDVRCDMSWNPRDEIPYALTRFQIAKDPTNILYFTNIVIGKNITVEQDRVLRQVYSDQNPKFQNWMASLATESHPPKNSQIWIRDFIDSIALGVKTVK